MKKLKTLKEHIVLTEGKIKPDATKFEGDLIGAMMHVSTGGQGTPRANRDTGSSNIKWDPEDYEDEVYKLATGIAEKMKKNCINIKNARRVGGKAGKLTKLYTDMRARSGEPKTDIGFGNYNVSVKGKTAQILSSQGGETAAVIQAAVLHDENVSAENKKMAAKAGDIMKKAFDKSMFDQIIGVRDQVELKYQLKLHKVATKKELPQDALDKIKARAEITNRNQDILKKVVGFDPNKPTDDEMKTFLSISQALGIDGQMQEQMANFIQSSVVKRGIVYEAATGTHKFTTKDSIATHMLAWGDEPDNPKYAFETADEFVNTIYPSVKIRISTRGAGTSKCLNKAIDDFDGDLEKALAKCSRGGSLRATINMAKLFETSEHCVPLEKEDYQYLEESWNDIEREGTRYLLENLDKTEELLLQEGVIDSLKKSYSKIKAGIKFLMGRLKGFFMSIGKFYMKALKNAGLFIQANMNMSGDLKHPPWKPRMV